MEENKCEMKYVDRNFCRSIYKCSICGGECHWVSATPVFKYCPNCGRKIIKFGGKDER